MNAPNDPVLKLFHKEYGKKPRKGCGPTKYGYLLEGFRAGYAAHSATPQGEVVADIKRSAIDVLWKIIDNSKEYDFPDGLGVGIPQSVFDDVQCLFDELSGDDEATLPTPPPESKREVCVWKIEGADIRASCHPTVTWDYEPLEKGMERQMKTCPYCGKPIVEQGARDE